MAHLPRNEVNNLQKGSFLRHFARIEKKFDRIRIEINKPNVSNRIKLTHINWRTFSITFKIQRGKPMNVIRNQTKLSMFKTVILSASIVFSTVADASVTSKKQEVDQFLRRVGFEDYVAMIAANQEKGSYIHSQAKDKAAQVLAEQKRNYRVFNDARQLTSELVALLADETRDQAETKRDLVAFTAQMIRNAPLMPTLEFPKSVDDADKAWDYAWNAGVARIEKHLKLIGADLVKVLVDGRANEKLFAENPNHENVVGYQTQYLGMRAKISRLLEFAYLNEVMGKSNYLAKALVAALVREDKLAGNTKLADAISKEVNPDGFYVENFVGSVLKIKNEKGVLTDINIQNGDFLNVRSYGMESWQISFAVRPGSLMNRALGYKHQLIGFPGGNFIFPEDGAEPTVDLSVKGVLKKSLADSKLFNRGISHLGMAMVKSDKETGIEVPWSVDVYPNAGLGGIRILDIPTQYFRDEYYFRFGVSRYNPKKFYDYVSEKHVYRPTLNFQYVKNPENPDAEVVVWKSKVSKKNYDNLVQAGQKDPNAWYARIMRRATDHFVNEFLAKGLGFAYGFKNESGQAYCSQAVFLSIFLANGIDPQPHLDQWNKLLTTLKKKGVEAAKDIDVGLRVISPVGFMWQFDVVEDKATQIIEYPYIADQMERAKKMFISEYKPIVKSDFEAITADGDFDNLLYLGKISSADYAEIATNDQYSYDMIQHRRQRAEAVSAQYENMPDLLLPRDNSERFLPLFLSVSADAFKEKLKKSAQPE